MSGETEKEVSGWTVDTLHIYTMRRFDDMERLLDERARAQGRAMEAALAAAEKAVGKAEKAGEKRFDSVNEFRQTLTDQAGTFVTRKEADAVHAAILDRLGELADRLNKAEGRAAGASQTVGLLLAVATVVISIVIIFVNVLLANR